MIETPNYSLQLNLTPKRLESFHDQRLSPGIQKIPNKIFK